MNKADTVLKSASIFTADVSNPINGYVAIKGNKILQVAAGDPAPGLIGDHTQVVCLGDKTVCPGFGDGHTFFTGYILNDLGSDLTKIASSRSLKKVIEEESKTDREVIFGHNLKAKFLTNDEVKTYINSLAKPVVLFTPEHRTFLMNEKASKFGISPDRTNFEALVNLIPVYLKDKGFVIKELESYMKMLNKRGVTSVKEIIYDHSYGLKEILKNLDDQKKLTVRFSFMSQPVMEKADVSYGVQMEEGYNSDFVTFSGFNQMTDGLIVCSEGDLLEPYEGTESCGIKKIDYEYLEKQVLDADKNGLRFTLHSEGDGAFHRILNIYEKCRHTANGKLVNRHGITDLELTTAKDRKRMASMGVFGEAYVQMLKTDSAAGWIDSVTKKVGTKRFNEYLNLRGLEDEGVTLAAATDLPFMIPNVPESIYYGCFNYAQDKKRKVNPQNALTIPEMLKAWTANAQYAFCKEKVLGTLEVGKLADITVFDKNIFKASEEEILGTEIVMTIVDGKIVYEKWEK